MGWILKEKRAGGASELLGKQIWPPGAPY